MLRNINCIIVDDNPILISYLNSYIEQINFLNLLGTFQNATESLEIIEEKDVDLIFLDVNMPELSGIDFARQLVVNKAAEAPRVIFITGYEKFALESYQVNALDYLLKPVSYEAFFRSIYKAKEYFDNINRPAKGNFSTYLPNDFVFLRVEHELIRVYMKDILVVESFKDYIKVYTTTQVFKALSTMKSAEEKLPSHSFMRIHRSFMISLDKIESVQNNTVRIGKMSIPVTENYRAQFKNFLQHYF